MSPPAALFALRFVPGEVYVQQVVLQGQGDQALPGPGHGLYICLSHAMFVVENGCHHPLASRRVTQNAFLETRYLASVAGYSYRTSVSTTYCCTSSSSTTTVDGPVQPLVPLPPQNSMLRILQ